MRNIKQLLVNNSCLFALCDDGTAWKLSDQDRKWYQLPAIPEGKGPTMIEQMEDRDRRDNEGLARLAAAMDYKGVDSNAKVS